MSARDDGMRRREERAAERLTEVGMNVPNFGGMRGKFDAKLHPKDRTGKWRQTFTNEAHELHVAGGQKHIATITKGTPTAKGQDTFHVKSEVGAGAKHATAGSLPEAKKIAHAMHGLKHEDIQHTGATSPKAGGAAAPKAAKPSDRPAVGSKAHQESLKPKPAGQEHGDWRDPHHNTGYTAAEYAQHHAQNEKFYKSAVQTLAGGPDHMSTKPSVGGPKITKHAGSFYVEHHDNVDANRPLWKSGKVPVLAGKFKSASAAAAAAAKMDTQDYMAQRRAEREAKGMAHGDSHAPVASASGGDSGGVGKPTPAAPKADGGAAAPPVFATRAKAHKELKPGDTFQIPDSANWKRSAGAKHGRVYKVVAGPDGKNRSVAHTTSDEKAANVASSQKRIAQQTASEKKPTPAETAAHQAQFEADLKGSAAGGLKASKKLDQQITDTQAKIPGAGAVVNGKAGRWVKLNGKMVHIPHHGDFLRVVGTDHFSSPDGGTTVYKNGSPYSVSKAAAKGAGNAPSPSKASGAAPQGTSSGKSLEGDKLSSALGSKWTTLPGFQQDAAELYVLGASEHINMSGDATYHDQFNGKDVKVAKIAGALDQAMKPLPVNAVVYRGVGKNSGPETMAGGFTSTTLTKDGALTHGEKALRIEVPAGTPALWLGPLTQGENELLLGRGAKFEKLPGDQGYRVVAKGGTPSGAANPDNLTQALKGELAAQGGAPKQPSATRQQARLDAAKVAGRMPPPLATPQVPALGGMTPLGITPSGSKAVLKPELNSPARSSVGRLRNFKGMSTDKLTQTLVATTAHGNDPEALQALQHEAAQRLGVHVPALAASLAPKPATSAPSAPSAPAAAQAAGQAAARAGVVANPSVTGPSQPSVLGIKTNGVGRGPNGKLRNFDAMGSDKFIGVASDVINENQDPEAIAAVLKRWAQLQKAGAILSPPPKLQEATFTEPQRKKLAAQGKAMSHGGFPIRNAEDLSNAIHALGRAKNPAAAKAHIRKRAKALGLESKLPSDWGNVKEADMGDRDAAMARRVQRRLSLIEAADSMAKASTPEPFSKSKTSNWVARGGGLPAYIQHIAHDLVEKRGMPESKAIAMAIGIVKRWARGGGKVDAGTRAAAAKAVSEWERLKAGAHAKP